MKGMAEGGLVEGRRLIAQLRMFVAGAAFADAKGFFTIMAGSAGFPFFHLGHGYRGIFAGTVQGAVTGGAVLHLCQMSGMTERSRAGFFHLVDDFFNLVAFAALVGIKSLFAVVAGTAGLALVHFSHGVVPFAFVCRVAGSATEGWRTPLGFFGQMLAMAEDNRTGILRCIGYIL